MVPVSSAKLTTNGQKTLGFTPEELLGKNLLEFVYPDDIDSTREVLHTCSEKEPTSDFENRFRCKNGTYRWFEWRFQPVENLIYIAARDITDRKYFEKEIAYILKFNSNIFCASPIGIATYNSKGECKSCNKSYAKAFGLTIEKINSLPLHTLESTMGINPIGFSNIVLNASDGKKTEIHLLNKENRTEWFDCNIALFTYDEELHYLILLQNISEKKKSEILIKESEHRFRNMLGSVKLLSIIIEPDGRISFLNDHASRVLGYSFEEVNNKNSIELFIHDPEMKNTLYNILQLKILPESIEVDMFTKDSSRKTIKWSITMLTDENKNFSGAACIGEDITEFKMHERILNFRYELIEKEHNGNIIDLIRFTLETAEQLTNSKISVFCFFDELDKPRIVQIKPYDNNHDSISKDVKPDYSVGLAGIWTECIEKRGPVIHNDYPESYYNNILPEGHPGIIRELVFPIIKDNKIVATIGLGNKESDYSKKDIEIVSLLCEPLWNIIDKKKTTNKLRKSEEELRALNLTKDKFFSIIAHDLKSPFQGMLGSLQILSSEFDDLTNDERKGFIKSIDNLSRRTYKLLENLLQWSRIQTENMEYNIQILSVNNVFNETIDLLSDVAAHKSISIHKDISDEYFAKADLNIALTVFRNLLSNAIKFTNNGGKINIYATQSDNLIEVFIEDNGIGMTEDELKNLFRIQNQQQKHGTQGETGTGLGLILCKEMIGKIGGSINVKSSLGKGTIFSFTLQKI